MRNRRPIDIVAGLTTVAALATICISCWEPSPRVDQRLHASIGQTLARETLTLLEPGGQITLVTRDPASFRQPALDILLKGFKRELRRKQVTVANTHLLQADPLRPVDIPSGDFFELIRRAPAGRVIVSLLGPPLLTEDQRNQLGLVKPKIVAFCPGNLGESIDLRQLFKAGLLHAAVVGRPISTLTTNRPSANLTAFDRLYRTVRAADATSRTDP